VDDSESTRDAAKNLLRDLWRDVRSEQTSDAAKLASRAKRPGDSAMSFGWGMIALAVVTLLIAHYPLPVGRDVRGMFLLFAIVELFVAAYFLDKGRKLNNAPEQSADVAEGEPLKSPKKGLRRLK
jgi:hypothetical protein